MSPRTTPVKRHALYAHIAYPQDFELPEAANRGLQMSDETEPVENKTERVQLLMTPREVEAIDDWGFSNRIRTRAEAIRQLARKGLMFDQQQKLLGSTLDIALKMRSGQVLNESEEETLSSNFLGHIRILQTESRDIRSSMASYAIVAYQMLHKDQNLTAEDITKILQDDLEAFIGKGDKAAKRRLMAYAKEYFGPDVLGPADDTNSPGE
jgi:hypothetical protein